MCTSMFKHSVNNSHSPQQGEASLLLWSVTRVLQSIIELTLGFNEDGSLLTWYTVTYAEHATCSRAVFQVSNM